MSKNKKTAPERVWQSLRRPARYRLTFVDENKMTQVWGIRMSRQRVIFSVALILLAVVSIGAMIISFTPLRSLLPGYMKATERREYLEAESKIDSLMSIVAVNDLYINNMNAILSGDISSDSLLEAAVDPQPLDTALLIGPSKAEKDFNRLYSQREGFSLDNATTVLPDAPAFVAPVRGAVARRAKDPLRPLIEITEPSAPVFAIARATVIDTYSRDDGRQVVILQHPDGYISRYDGLTKVYHKRGEQIASGAKIGVYDSADDSRFGFELSRDGSGLNPLEYIPF